jgi:hypothetical protein
MRSLIVILALLVGACSSQTSVTPEHFAKATSECSSHAGLKIISQADQQEESLNCGRYCNKVTGRVQYHAEFSCNDDTKIDLMWFK